MRKTISILGCGWLGQPLGRCLVQHGFAVSGSTTTAEKMPALLREGIQPFLINLSPAYQGTDMPLFLNSEVLIIDIPPGLKKNAPDFHIAQITNFLESVKNSQVKKIIYISSTSIYPDSNREVFEEDVTSEMEAANKTLAACEHMVAGLGREYIIARCAGLTGYDRILVRHFAGKTGLPGSKAPVNLIHRDDVVALLHQLIVKGNWNETYNLCAPHHPTRGLFYTSLAQKTKVDRPVFDEALQQDYKIVNASKITAQLNYEFKYPDPLTFEYSQMAQ